MAVTKIPKKTVTLIEPKKSFIVDKAQHRQKRVAAYCRVSSSSADQLNSYATQIDYYTKLAKKKKSEWNMVEIFADEHAIIGTSGENLVKSRVSALVPFNFFVKGKYNFI